MKWANMTWLTEAARRIVEPLAVRALLGWERLESGVSYHPGSARMIEDPYGACSRIRRADPVHRTRLIDGWLLTRYRDVDRVLRDHRRFSNSHGFDVQARTGVITMLDVDPPDHTRLRALVSQAFSARAIGRLRTRIEGVAEALMNKVAGQGQIELMSALAYPLPITVIAEMLGVPPQDMDRFEGWSNDVALNVEPVLGPEGVRRVRRARSELGDYFEGFLAQRRREPQDDVVSALLAAEEDGGKLSHEEVITTLILLLAAGNETTRNLIGNGTLALLSHPDQLERLRRDPGLIDSAVKELLRFDPPVQLDARRAVENVSIGGRMIRAGQVVLLAIGSANRDPEVFSDPDRLDIGRRETSHLSFGRGIHYCLGAALAEMEARIAFTVLLRRFSSMRLNAKPKYRRQIVLRGVEELWIDVEPAQGIET